MTKLSKFFFFISKRGI